MRAMKMIFLGSAFLDQRRVILHVLSAQGHKSLANPSAGGASGGSFCSIEEAGIPNREASSRSFFCAADPPKLKFERPIFDQFRQLRRTEMRARQNGSLTLKSNQPRFRRDSWKFGCLECIAGRIQRIRGQLELAYCSRIPKRPNLPRPIYLTIPRTEAESGRPIDRPNLKGDARRSRTFEDELAFFQDPVSQ